MKQYCVPHFLSQPKLSQQACANINSIPILLSIMGALSVLGCQPPERTKSDQSLSSTGQYCKIETNPFNYSLCEMQQETLLEKNNKLALKLYWREDGNNTDKESKPLYTFNNAQQNLPDGQKILFANNAGMYNADYAPIGYTVIDGEQILSLNRNEGAGNFHLMPNGVFWWDEHGYYISESSVMEEMLKSGTKPKYATQSGPMLVINGETHPKFKADSTSTKIRNGVGICDNGMIKFVTSNTPVNFYEFATLYKDTLNCDNALFFDGGIASALYAPEIQRKDSKNMGVLVGLIETNDKTNK